MNVQVLINTIVQQTTVLIAHLATLGGLRIPVAQVANQVFLDLSKELQSQGVKKNVIADMFGMALRTYHRRVRAIAECQTDKGCNVWEAVLDFIRKKEPVSARQVLQRFHNDDSNIVSGVLNDLANTGLVYRAGQADHAIYRIAAEADFLESDCSARREANEYLIWLTVYRCGPVSLQSLSLQTHLEEAACNEALETLLADGRVKEQRTKNETTYKSDRFDVVVGSSKGWEAAVLDHFQAMVSAVCVKLRSGIHHSANNEATGGGTYSFDVWPGHPLEYEARSTLSRVRTMVNHLRDRIDEHNRKVSIPNAIDQVVFYMGQYIKSENELSNIIENDNLT